jgi:hypothetical protein
VGVLGKAGAQGMPRCATPLTTRSHRTAACCWTARTHARTAHLTGARVLHLPGPPPREAPVLAHGGREGAGGAAGGPAAAAAEGGRAGDGCGREARTVAVAEAASQPVTSDCSSLSDEPHRQRAAAEGGRQAMDAAEGGMVVGAGGRGERRRSCAISTVGAPDRVSKIGRSGWARSDLPFNVKPRPALALHGGGL